MADTYRLNELGWVQFERLCTELLRLCAGVEVGNWQGRADRLRVVTVPEGVEVVPGRPVAGPALVAVWWLPAAVEARLMHDALAEHAASWLADELGPPAPASVVLLTNAGFLEGGAEALAAEVARASGAQPELQIPDPDELGAVLDAEPLLRRRLPSVLGARDLDELVPQGLLDRSSGDVEAARALARIFVPTRAYAQTLAVLERHGFAVLTGPPEMGKTAIARMLGLALLTEGWELHECVRPDDFWQRLNRKRPQLFIADDAFGSTEYRPEAAERWVLELGRVLRAMDERHWLVWTSRPAPLKAGLSRIHREHGVERWPVPAEVQVAASELDLEEKALILYRHTRAADAPELPRRLVQRYGFEIVSHRHFTPERIRRFVSTRLVPLAAQADELGPRELARAVEAEIREPTEAMATSLRALPPEHRALLVGLLDAPPGPVAERNLAAAARRHGEGGLPKPPGELVDRLTDHFLRLVPPASVSWVHPSWRDLVIGELAADPEARRRFLTRCGIDGVLLALSTGGGAAGERTLPLLLDDGDWDTLTDRVHMLVDELATTDLVRLLQTLQTALAAVLPDPQRRELAALAGDLLELLGRRWNIGDAVIDVATLEALQEVRSLLPQPRPPLPRLRASWLDLRPFAGIDITSPGELARFDDWLRLSALVREEQPELAFELDLDRELGRLLVRLHDEADALATFPTLTTTPLLARCLRRIAQLAPELADAAQDLAHRLGPAAEPETVFDLPVSAPYEGSAASTEIVGRILRDLDR